MLSGWLERPPHSWGLDAASVEPIPAKIPPSISRASRRGATLGDPSKELAFSHNLPEKRGILHEQPYERHRPLPDIHLRQPRLSPRPIRKTSSTSPSRTSCRNSTAPAWTIGTTVPPASFSATA